MPTTRPRYFITETDALAAALDTAAARWPGLSRPQLLVRLALAAAEPRAAEERLARRRAALDRIEAGEFSGLYPPDYLERLREDWPA
jgi:hypothetical protein